MKIAGLSGLSDQNLVTNPQCYKDRQNSTSLLSISMGIIILYIIKMNYRMSTTPVIGRSTLVRLVISGYMIKLD